MTYFLFYASLIFLAFVGFETFYPHPAPVFTSNVKVEATRLSELLDIDCSRDVKVLKSFVGSLSMQFVDKKTGDVYENASSISEYSKDDSFVIKRHSVFSNSMPSGAYVMRSKVVWRPTFSLIDHIAYTDEVDFIICSDPYETCGNLKGK